MAIVAKWLTHRIVAPTFVGSIPINRPIFKSKLGYGQVVKASDSESDTESSNLSSPAKINDHRRDSSVSFFYRMI